MEKIYKLIPLFCITVIVTSRPISGQETNAWTGPPQLNISGFVDVFYAYDFNKPTTKYRQSFFYNHNRHNEVNLNLGIIALGIKHKKYRAKIALQTGTYASDTYAEEPGLLKNVFEAYAGISLNRKNNLWLDAGIFLSHLGIENPMSIEDWTLTRSLTVESLPYYLSGAKLTYKPSDVVQILGVVCNGWQRIQRVAGNSMPSFGTQLLITPNDKYTFSWGTFVGTDDPDSTRRMMYFNDLYAIMQFVEKFGVSAEFDFGARQKSKDEAGYDTWYGFSVIARYNFAKKWATALRGEYYYDNEGVIISIENSPYGFKTSGFSLNVDFIPIPQVACRIEGRWLHSADEIYFKENNPTHNDFFIVGSIAVKLDKNIL